MTYVINFCPLYINIILFYFQNKFINFLFKNVHFFSPLDYFLQLWPDMSREDGRKFLGRYGISGNVQTQIMSQLSG